MLLTTKSSGYKAGVVLLFISTVLFIIGFAAPYWIDSRPGSNYHRHGNRGVWVDCSYFSILFTCYDTAGSDGLVSLWQAFECFTLLLLVASCILCLVVDVFGVIQNSKQWHIMESAAGLGGLLGFTTSMVYVGINSRWYMSSYDFFAFAFYLATIGSGLAVISSLILAANNRRLMPSITTTQNQNTSSVVVVNNSQSSSSQGGNTFAMQSYPPC